MNDSEKPMPPFNSEMADPYSFYASLRLYGDSVRDPGTGSIYVVGHDLVAELLAERSLHARGALALDQVVRNRELFERVEAFFSKWMVFDDRPQHALLRRRLSSSVAGPRSASLIEGVRQNVPAVVENAKRDALTDIALPLTMAAMRELLGAVNGEADDLACLANALIAYLSTSELEETPARLALHAIRELEIWTVGALGRCRGPLLPILDTMVRTRLLTNEEATATVAQFLTGIVEPTTTLLAGTLEALRCSPSLMDDVVRGKIHSSDVVEEALRLDPPFHFAPRTAGCNMQIGKIRANRGDRVVLVLASANRDPRRWERPETFDASRPRIRHLAFGMGRHSCLGSTLARSLACSVIEAVARRPDRLAALRPLTRTSVVGGTRWRPLVGAP